MTDPLVFISSLLITAILGFNLGRWFSNLKNKEINAVASEQKNQLTLQIEELKTNITSTVSNYEDKLAELKSENFSHLEKLERERENLRTEKEILSNELTRRNSEFENLLQKNLEHKSEVEKLQEKFSTEFENLANRILEQKSEKFTKLNRDNIQNVLDPLNERIKSFENKIDRNSNDFIERHAQLGKQLQFLNEQNIKISEEAINLTKALKGNTKMQGGWGEMILERVLERSGLQKDSEYFVQQNFRNQNGRNVRPDVVIHLPGDKRMIVDSKVSLVAYEKCINGDEEQERRNNLKSHLQALKNHVQELHSKNYHSLYGVESPDFVLLFIPIEAAFAMASNEYPELYREAFDKNIIIVTPTTLLAVLKTIDSMWQNEKQKQNAIDIANQAGALYDSFVNLTDELLKVGRQLDTVQGTYETAMKKLTGKGNLITRVEKLKKLGAKASKQVDKKLISGTTVEALDPNNKLQPEKYE